MASVTWTLGNATANWSTGTDWTGKSVPVSGDSVFLNQNLSGNGYTVTLDASEPATGSYAALSVGNGEATLALSTATKTLSVTGLTTLSAGKIDISNTSTLSTGTFLGSGGTFTESNGLLSVTAAGATALSVTAGSFTLSGGTVSVTSGASFTGGTDTISGGAFNAGTVTVDNALTFSGGTITSGAGGVTVASGKTVTISGTADLNATTGGVTDNGTLTGSGTVDGAISGNGTVTASGATLDLKGTVNGPVLTVANVAGSDLKIDGTASSAAALSITSNNQTLEVGSVGALTIGAAQNVTLGKILISGGKLTDASGISFGTGTSNGTLSGFGTLAANLTRSGTGTADTITAKGGTLDVAGNFASGLVAAIDSAATADLKFDGTATSATAITINNAFQTLEVGTAGSSLTIGAAQNVTLGRIQLDGGTLTDSSGISFGTTTSNGTLSGFGTVAANLTRSGTGVTDTITASGGTLDLTGTFGSGLVAAIDSAQASDLKFDSTSTVTALSITNANQTLEVHSGTLTLTGAQTVSRGHILMSGGTLADTSGIVLGSSSNAGDLIGSGTVSAGITKGGTSTTNLVEASGGNLTLSANVGAATGLAYEIANSAASVLQLNGSVAAGNTFTFLGAAGELAYNQTGGITENVVGLNVGTSPTPTNFIDYKNHTVSVSGSNAHSGSGPTTVTLNDGSTLSLSGLTGSASGTWFVNTQSDGSSGTDIFLSNVCYAAGTHILTATGERMVENLTQGATVSTLSDGQLREQPVKWIGRRHIDLTAHPRPETAAPIRIRRGAFADDMPHSDLLVSPDHAIFVDDRLICARQLINGTTIYQEKGWTSVEYFHVELDSHAILLAEGLPAESYLNTGNHGFFANSDQPLVLHPDLTVETDYPTREAGSCVPFVWDEGSVYPVWRRLAERAEILGRPASSPETTRDPQLCIVVEGRTVRPVHCKNGLYTFALPKGATEIRLVSRAGSPTDVRPWLNDRRSLGVNVERIVLRSEREVRIVPLDQPGLTQGWWPVEQDGIALSRWTNAEAVLSLPSMDGPAMLEIRAGCGEMSYLVTAAQASLAA